MMFFEDVADIQSAQRAGYHRDFGVGSQSFPILLTTRDHMIKEWARRCQNQPLEAICIIP